jgi:arginine utilization protein RocB
MPSVSGTAGEAAKGRFLARWLEEHCGAGTEGSAVELAVAAADAQTAPTVLACWRAEPATQQTLILMGHYDTVGSEPYGPLEASAYDSAALKQAFSHSTDAALAAQARSSDWAFGRGALDMQGGVAAALLAFCEVVRQKRLPLNLALLLCPGEESDSLGVRLGLEMLGDLRDNGGLRFAGLLNADYCVPDSESKAAALRPQLYGGTCGKLLLGVSVFGLPVHVGEPFGGLNSAALAAELAVALELNPKLQCGSAGQWLPPPTVLELRSRRERYDVMSAECSEFYLNCFHLGSLGALWRRIEQELRRGLRAALRRRRQALLRARQRDPLLSPAAERRVKVMGYAELLATARQSAGADAVEAALALAEAPEYRDEPREAALAKVRALEALLPPGQARIVLSLLLPYYPAQLRQGEAGRRAKAIALKLGLQYLPAYPCISDMSYFAFPPSDSHGAAELASLAAQAPLWFDPDELHSYGMLAQPVMNIGPLGHGAHSAFERVHLPSLAELPARLLQALHELTQLGG